MPIKGSVDQIDTKGATGWIFNTTKPEPMLVEAVLHHRVIGEALAEAYRHDLAEVGLGDGRCGFTVEFGLAIEPAYLPFVTVRPVGGDVELPRTSLSGFADFLSSLHTSLPTNGRPKSVFGGLWTDRTDALAILGGHRRLNRHGVDVATSLERFIVHGYVVLDLGLQDDSIDLDGPEFDSLDELERKVAPAFFRSAMQDTLTAIFDDVPVVTSATILYDMQRSFRQPCTDEQLSSPLECMSLVTSNGVSPTSIEVVRDSHNFPDFTRTGEVRWLLPAGDAALGYAASIGAPVDVLTLRRGQVAILAAGIIHRVLHPSADGTTQVLCIPRRRLPLRVESSKPHTKVSSFEGKIALADAL